MREMLEGETHVRPGWDDYFIGIAMQVRHSLYLRDNIGLGELLQAVKKFNIPESAELDWDYNEDAMYLIWFDE